MAAESRHERPVRRGRIDDGGGDGEAGEKLYYHLTLLAETDQGYKNLLKLSSAAYLEGYYYKPRAGLGAARAPPRGPHRHHRLPGRRGAPGPAARRLEQATALAARLQDIFGRDNLFVELQDHGLPEQHKTNPQLIEIARRIGAPLLATNDSHYTRREDAVAHDALLCVQTGSAMDDPKRFKFDGDEHYLKTAAEMRHLFAELPGGVRQHAVDRRAGRRHHRVRQAQPARPSPRPRAFARRRRLPAPPDLSRGRRSATATRCPADVRRAPRLRARRHLRHGLLRLLPGRLGPHPPRPGHGIRVGPGRGSAAGCCVAYCLRIVDLDPIRYDLLFERFLNPGRKQMPDIDMDFDERYRSEMIRYAAERYGWDHVAQIVTFSTIKARAAVRDAARVLGLPLQRRRPHRQGHAARW